MSDTQVPCPTDDTKTKEARCFPCGSTGSGETLQHQPGHRFDPSPAQWINDLVLQSCRIGHNCSSDLISGLGTAYASEKPKKRKKREKRRDDKAQENLPPCGWGADSMLQFCSLRLDLLRARVGGRKPYTSLEARRRWETISAQPPWNREERGTGCRT